MDYDEAFVREVRANPQDDTPRLIFADYLDEAGDARGEFIRVQVQLSRLHRLDPQRAELESRENELLAEFGEEWLAPLRELGAQGVSVRCFHKGLIQRIKIAPVDWIANDTEICRISPALHQLQLVKANDFFEPFSEAELPAQITALDLSSNGLERQLGILSNPPWCAQLEALDLSFNRLRDDGIGDLTEMQFPRLKTLFLRVNGIGPEGSQRLAAWGSLSNLINLSLSLNSIGDIGSQSLADSPLASKLEELDLSANGITARGARAIAESQALRSLRELNLRANGINNEGLEALRASRHLTALRLLDMRGNSALHGDYGTRSRSQDDLLIRFDRSAD